MKVIVRNLKLKQSKKELVEGNGWELINRKQLKQELVEGNCWELY